MSERSAKPTIAVFDSGIGGITILSALTTKMPAANYIYYGDTANAPYGPRPAEEIYELSCVAIKKLLVHQPDVVVLACNTVTSTSISLLRQTFPDVRFVGVEPAVKTAAAKTHVKKIVVAATSATLNSDSYTKLKKQWASDVEVIDLPKPEWVKMIEENEVVDAILEADARDIQSSGTDVLVLACTHFPFLKSKLQQLLPGITIIDSAEPVAEQVKRVLERYVDGDEAKEPTVTWLFSNHDRPGITGTEKLWTVAQRTGY